MGRTTTGARASSVCYNTLDHTRPIVGLGQQFKAVNDSIAMTTDTRVGVDFCAVCHKGDTRVARVQRRETFFSNQALGYYAAVTPALVQYQRELLVAGFDKSDSMRSRACSQVL